jgi:zinc protease
MKTQGIVVGFLLLVSAGALGGIADKVVRSNIDGVDLIASPTAVKDVVTIFGSMPAGDAFAGSGNPAVPTLTAMMLDKGTTTSDKFAIAQQLESVGATISFSVSQQTLDIQAKCLRKDAPTIVHLIMEQMRTPAFSADEFAKARIQLTGAIRRSLEDTDTRADIALSRALFPSGHPNRKAAAEDLLAAVGNATLADVKAFHAKYYGPAHLTVAIVGDLDLKPIQAQLRRDLAGWHGGVPALSTPQAPRPDSAATQPINMPDKTSVSVILGQASGLRYSDSDALALRVGAAILGSGFTGRLMHVVRDQEGLTYGIYAGVDDDTYTDGDWLVGASFAPELLDKGVASTRREVERWWREGITQEELAARKKDLIGSYKVGLATTGGLARTLLRTVQRGKPLSWLDDYPRAVDALTVDQVNAAIRRHLKPDSMVLVEAGTLPKGK